MIPVCVARAYKLRQLCHIKCGVSNFMRLLSSKDGKPSDTSRHDRDTEIEQDHNDKSKKAAKKLKLLLDSIVQDTISKPSSREDLVLAQPKSQASEEENNDRPKLRKETFEEGLDFELVDAVREVSSILPCEPGQVKSELLSKLRGRDGEDLGEGKAAVDFSDFLVGMKINRNKPVEDMEGSRARKVRMLLNTARRDSREPVHKGRKGSVTEHVAEERKKPRRYTRSVDIFGSEALGIFVDSILEQCKEDAPELNTWCKVEDRELRLNITHPPTNGFEEMILWTRQGKLWQFPINNEFGLGIESKVGFHEHVFLEGCLQPWCHKKGPIHHFMELVCVGLSKNPYLTVEQKKDHVKWFEKYFDNNKLLLKECGAITG